uniref:Uncharacterized protein n=1 Tax=Octopus bimaculoides TaxID=37653 RepID=A0A0L8I2Y8_OCTBM
MWLETNSPQSSIQMTDNSLCHQLEEPQSNGPSGSLSGDRLSDASSPSSTGNGYQCDSESGDQVGHLFFLFHWVHLFL